MRMLFRAWIFYLSLKALITPPIDYWGDVNFPLKLLLLTGLHEVKILKLLIAIDGLYLILRIH